MQNLLASLVLIAWPLVAIILFSTLSLSRAILWTIMAAQMALPVGAFFKFEMIPQFDKFSVPNLCVIIGCMIVAKSPLRIITRLGLTELLIITFLFSPVITSQLNGDPIVFGNLVLPGVGLYDALGAAENAFIVIIPFFVGRQFLRAAKDSREILYVLAMAGLIYSIPMLFEIRMSPNLQSWIYGFAATDFVMEIRGGGYRPVVFMGHGLIASFFMMTAAVAAAGLWRARIPLYRLPSAGLTAYLSGVLVLCKSFGALLYGILLIPAVRWTSARSQMRLAVVLVSIAMVYPALRSFGLFPTQPLLETVHSFSEERWGSLRTRFDNENKLLDRWSERPIFGWGRYGRNRVFNAESGRDETITDGLWIITIGQYGLLGFLAQFGLLSHVVFRAASAFKWASSNTDAIFVSTIALIVSVNIVELIPNSGLLPWTWLLCGALLGRAEALKIEAVYRRRGVKMGRDPASLGAFG
jgi:hypothetical protein